MFNVTALKAAMKDAGYVVTEGPNLDSKDMREFYNYAYFVHGLNKAQAGQGLAYPSTVSSAIPGHPDNPNTPKVAAAVETVAPIVAPAALIPPVVFPPPVVPSTPDDSQDDQLKHTSGEVIETPDLDLE